MSSRDTRTTILEATRERLESRAWSGTGLEKIARAAGVSRQALYLHFGSRSALLLALVNHVDEVEGLVELAEPVLTAPSGVEALNRLVHLNALYEPRIRSVVLAHDAARHLDPDLEAAWQDRMARRRGLCRDVVTRLEGEGALAEGLTRDEATDLLWALLAPHLHEDLVGERRWSTRRYEARMRSLLRRALVRE